MSDVSVVRCDDYQPSHLREALIRGFAPFGGFSFVRPGMLICIKTNLVHASKPDKAAVTHPAFVAELTRLLTESGAKVIVGDSPGGLWNSSTLSSVYRACGMSAVEEAGGKLNRDFSQETVSFPEAVKAKEFPFTSWLKKADLVIDCCKLKTHGMMGMTCAAKNLFGVIPGTTKPEFHYLYPDHADFARMIIDLDEYVKPAFSVCDAIVGMEGNGPTGGTPRKIGCILVSPSPHKLDLVAADLIGLTLDNVPTLAMAYERGLIPKKASELTVDGVPAAFRVPDFRNVATEECRIFTTKGQKGVKKLFWKCAEVFLTARPDVWVDECVGCGQCRDLCPAKAIVLKDGKAVIHRKTCIRCFCCQEFCPRSAIKVKRSAIARMLTKNDSGTKK